MTRNQKLHVLHVDSAPSFANSQIMQYVRGDTLLFDFVYFLHPVGSPSASIQAFYLVKMACSRVLMFRWPCFWDSKSDHDGKSFWWSS